MNCKRARRMMSVLADRQLPSEESDSLMRHLRSCSSCAPEHRQTARLSEILNGLAVPNPGEGYWGHLAASVQERVHRVRGGRRTSAVLSKPLLAAAAAVIAALGVGIILATFRGQDVLAATLEAMAEVNTAHILTTEGQDRGETWYSDEHGLRSESSWRVRVLTSEATWEYRKDENKLIISEPEPDTIKEYLNELSGTRWLDALKSAPTQYRYRVSDAVLEGKAAKRLDVEAPQGQMKATFWIDADTMRVIELEQWEKDDAGHWVLLFRARVEYDVPLDPALFTFEPPLDATVIECRLDPEFRDVIKKATEAARTLPIHEVGKSVSRLVNDNKRHWDDPAEWEAWRQNGVGYREEYPDGAVKGATTKERWYCCDRDGRGYINDNDARLTRPMVLQYLESLQRGELWGIPIDAAPELTYQEKDGRRLARVVIRGEHRYNIHELAESGSPFEIVGHGREQQKRVYTFDCDAKRLIECEQYVLEEGRWRLFERLQLEYLDRLPEGIFELDPPPGAKIDDLRGH